MRFVHSADRFPRDFTIDVNICGLQFARADFVAAVEDALRRHDVPPEFLCLDLTESVLMRAGHGVPSPRPEHARCRRVRGGCDEVQRYLFGKAMPPADALDWRNSVGPVRGMPDFPPGGSAQKSLPFLLP
jgi:EAL domain-containing protein (putative c-di-GMP-specific phosphodiesterase class I)